MDTVADIITRYSAYAEAKGEDKTKLGEELFVLVHSLAKQEWDPSSARPLKMYPISNFRDLLSDKARIVYDRKELNTVVESLAIEGINQYDDPDRFNSLAKEKAFDVTKYLRERKDGPNYLELQANFMQYIALEANLDFGLEGPDQWNASLERCISRFAKLFNYLVDKGIIYRFVMNPGAFAMPLVGIPGRIVMAVFVGAKYDRDGLQDPVKELNALAGMEIFCHEGEMCQSFDWTKIDNL